MSVTRAIRRLAIVNRGEAAMRCIRAVKALRAVEGSELAAVALYTAVERDAPFVRHADLSAELPARNGAVAAYLDHERLLCALREVGADAVWPGWGFVAEDPSFVERLAAEGIRFLGPSAQAMRRLGDKIASKRVAEAAGVPVAPWSGAAVDGAEDASCSAARIGYPLLVKAAAGGGGRGIRMAQRAEDLPEALRAAAAEAGSAFGDARVFLEAKVSGGRHVEVQIAADAHGHVLALGCRDCSVQRRHQKVVEEAPPPGLDAAFLARLEACAVSVARAVGYEGVGTVEFLVAGGAFYFLEVNPRLQVEHGITEALTGVDLVELQIRIARGERLDHLRPVTQGWAMEARVCAEDPDAGFLPAPGRIARFDPALGPRVRVDTGFAAGSVVSADFDSLIAKVIASGASREEARARLACALLDFDLVIEGGATNKGFLLDVLDAAELRAGGVDTEWLDRFCAAREGASEYTTEALVAAAILSYQSARNAARLAFYADTTNPSPSRVPPSGGQCIDLAHGGESYRVEVFAVGSWRYRVHCDGRVVAATLREEDAHTARLVLGERTLRILHDVTDAGLRVEVEGRAHFFGSQAVGSVRSGTPAMVVAVHVSPGDRVEAGTALGVLEAMKTEIRFESPVSGVVTEVRVQRGQQVAAGDVLVVVDPAGEPRAAARPAARLGLPELPDPLEPLVGGAQGPDLARLDQLDPERRRAALATAREEVRRVFLGYDANPQRAELLRAFLDAPLPEKLSDELLWQLAEIRADLTAFADVGALFVRAPSASPVGEPGPSNSARLRMFVRRIHAAGAGLDEGFLALVRAALAHYRVASLEPSRRLERAVLRLLASQGEPELRQQLLLAVLNRIAALAERGVHLGDDHQLEDALGRIAGMRGLLNDAVADAAADASYAIFERPRIERLSERTSKELDSWLAAAEEVPQSPPESVLRHLADGPPQVFERVRRWMRDDDPRRVAIACTAWLRRLYSPRVPLAHLSAGAGDTRFDRVLFDDGRVVLAASCAGAELAGTARALLDAAGAELPGSGVAAIELFATAASQEELDAAVEALARLPAGAALRVTLNALDAQGRALHRGFAPHAGRLRPARDAHGIHPETARRIDLARLEHFSLERIPAPDDLYCFHGRSRSVPSDERIFVLADARSRAPDDGREAALHLAAFEHAFYEATRALRHILRDRDPKRRLQWNRLALFVSPALYLEPAVVQRLSRRLAPATRHLGLEKVVVRLELLDRDAPERPPEPIEFVITDLTGSNLEIARRSPSRAPLEPRGEYERSVVEARRRRLAHPYEIVRMLTGGGGGSSPAQAPALPVGRFEEFDLDPAAARPRAVSVAGRPFGGNSAAVVFGIVTTPTEKVPEGMSRVLLLSDPTVSMGSLAAPECDRIVAAIDLAEQRGVPVEWVPVSSGARIAMESGTENLDATARVVRSIIEFTQAGGVIHVIVSGVNVGAQSYFDALATMLPHTRGALVMTPRGSMVLTGRAALEASGSVSAEDEVAIGGFERIMGPNGEAQYLAQDLADAWRILYEHYAFTYVVPGEAGPRPLPSADPLERPVCGAPVEPAAGEGFQSVGEIFDPVANPGRKRPFPMRALMAAVIDRDGGHLERWRGMAGAESSIVWDAHLGGRPVCLIGIESHNVARQGYRPLDGPASWTAGTLFPLSSKKVARALNAASGNRPVVVLANLSGFDGSPESMRKLQLEYGAEIARAVVNFRGPIVFLVVSRYHGGAYVVFSRELNPGLRAAALEGSYASVIGGAPAAAVVFPREVRARALDDPRVAELARAAREDGSPETRARFERALADAVLEKQAEVAAEFDAVHTVERARDVGSLEAIVPVSDTRAFLIGSLRGGS
jgi:acetyl/propionyl-CoA carboxylase alpha subunit/acetyl-CoA carboxylase carboxyltransferase component